MQKSVAIDTKEDPTSNWINFNKCFIIGHNAIVHGCTNS